MHILLLYRSLFTFNFRFIQGTIEFARFSFRFLLNILVTDFVFSLSLNYAYAIMIHQIYGNIFFLFNVLSCSFLGVGGDLWECEL
jgi:hypothetical protein